VRWVGRVGKGRKMGRRPVDLDTYNRTLGTASAPRTVDNPYESYASRPAMAVPARRPSVDVTSVAPCTLSNRWFSTLRAIG
jgi:hypothetical protein